MSATVPTQGIFQTWQTIGQTLSSILTLLKTGIAVQPVAPSYTVVALPATAQTGAYAWATNGRKPGEGAGAGTGVPVFWNPSTSQWFSSLSGAQVTA